MQNKITIIFISGPFSGPRRLENIRQARLYSKLLWNIPNAAVICPHLNSGCLYREVPEDIVLAGYLEMIRRSDVVFMLPGWEVSSGSRKEYDEAIRCSKPIYQTFRELRDMLSSPS